MLREEIKKYVVYSSVLRQKIKETTEESKKQKLIKELADVYSKLEFLRGLCNAVNLSEKGSRKI